MEIGNSAESNVNVQRMIDRLKVHRPTIHQAILETLFPALMTSIEEVENFVSGCRKKNGLNI